MRSLHERAGTQKAAVAELAEQQQEAERQRGQLAPALAQYADLERTAEQLARRMEQREAGWRAYVQNESLAGHLPARREAVDAARRADQESGAAARLAGEALAAAEAAYDSKAHAAADESVVECSTLCGRIETALEQATRTLEEQARRAGQYAKLRDEAADLAARADRLSAASVLLAKARAILKAVGPLLAEQLAAMIVARAQPIYNRITGEPGQLIWTADGYDLSVETASGPRRFAMLSGGEQTRAALAMLLAMVQQFSSAGLCIFDEPTNGLDPDSRRRLAEAVLAVQEQCRFDQLIVVSHDTAFEGLIEHCVVLRNAGQGSTVVE
jgi:exonuclease SbcC